MRMQIKDQDRFKTRCWSIKEKKYLQKQDNGLFIMPASIPNQPPVNVVTSAEEIANNENYGKTVLLEQCTGCRDCAGDLIYEGDILEIPEDEGTSYVAVALDEEYQRWSVKGDTEVDYEFYDLVNRPGDLESSGAAISDIGVVGNIHENSDLVK